MTDKITIDSGESKFLGFDDALALTKETIRRQLSEAPPPVRLMTRHLARAEGKNIRARSLLACALRTDGAIHRDAIQVASAIEITHLATLVHDDIIDRADFRRGIETLHMKYGEKNAVLCGDYLLCLAISLASVVNEHEERRDMAGDRTALPRYITDICLGELRENQNNRRFDLSERTYMRIISGKTASLFELSFYCGFMLSDSDSADKDIYTEIGRNMGLIFQLADDCLDYEACQNTAKKPVLSDFRQGVVTLPLIYAIKNDASLMRRINDEIPEEQLRSAVESSGGLRYTRSKISVLYNKSVKKLNTLAVTDEKREFIASLLALAAGL